MEEQKKSKVIDIIEGTSRTLLLVGLCALATVVLIEGGLTTLGYVIFSAIAGGSAGLFGLMVYGWIPERKAVESKDEMHHRKGAQATA